MRISTGLLCAALLLGGCSTLPPLVPRAASPGIYAQFDDADLTQVTAGAVRQLIGNLRQPIDPNIPVLVATLSDVNDLEHSSALGRIVTEQIATGLVQNGYAVPQVTLRRSMLVKQGEGEFVLSRDLRSLAPLQGAQVVVTGTYAVGRRVTMVSLRIIRLMDSRIIAAYDYDLPMGPNTLGLARTIETP